MPARGALERHGRDGPARARAARRAGRRAGRRHAAEPGGGGLERGGPESAGALLRAHRRCCVRGLTVRRRGCGFR